MRLRNIALLVLLSLLVNPLHAKNNKHQSEYSGSKKEKKSKKHKSMPKGLQKKVDRGGKLPNGWQNKLVKGDVLDKEVYKQSKVISPINIRGEITIEVDNRLIRLHKATREIIDILK